MNLKQIGEDLWVEESVGDIVTLTKIQDGGEESRIVMDSAAASDLRLWLECNCYFNNIKP